MCRIQSPAAVPAPSAAPLRGRAAGTKAPRAQPPAARGLVARVPLVPESCSVAPAGIPSWRWPRGCCSVVKPERGGGGALGGGSGVRSPTPAPNKALLCSCRRASGDGFLLPRFWRLLPSSSVSCPAAGALNGPDPDLQSLPPNPCFSPSALHWLLRHLSLSSSSSWLHCLHRPRVNFNELSSDQSNHQPAKLNFTKRQKEASL